MHQREVDPVDAPKPEIDSEWVQCDLCQKWRIVKCTDIDELEEDVAWVCSMNADVRHNVRFCPMGQGRL